MIVAKFGGSSLCDAELYEKVADTVSKDNIPVVIVSAPGGKTKITDLLINTYAEWLKTGECGENFYEVCDRFKKISDYFGIKIDSRLKALKAEILSGCGYDYAVSRGEYFSAFILSQILGYKFLDAKECVKLDLTGQIDFDSVIAHGGVIRPPCVIPGFYGKMPNGKIKLLPRGGSDISGAAIAAALGGEYRKCTDVHGILDGHGGIIENLSYDEAELLCYFGATVMHYESMPILKKAGVKLTVKNAFSDDKGTVVSNKKIDGYAVSQKDMFLCENLINEEEIINEGLKIPFKSELLGRKTLLIDGCGFSPLAIRRILGDKGVKPVRVKAVVGNISDKSSPGRLLLRCEIGSVFVSEKS